MVPFVSGFIILILFVLLFFYRFFRNPSRIIPGGPDDLVSAADGRVIESRRAGGQSDACDR
ncbi:MAG: phosphatidylserine decarboxylase [Bacteroidales bacterium]|nr:phosphatidylserine decarboxylase [Bacteroidales bacterium]